MYTGDGNLGISFHGVNIVLESRDGPSSTSIGAMEWGDVFHFDDGEDTTSVVSGFRVLSAHQHGNGGAVTCSSSSPLVRDCVFDNCFSELNGGAVHCHNSSAVFRNCSFIECQSDGLGGAIYAAANSTITVSNCLFNYNNTVGDESGIVHLDTSDATITRCTFAENGGSMIGAVSCAPTITNCVLSTKTTEIMYCGPLGDPHITHSVIWSFAPTGGDSLCGTHHDNIIADPLFCDDTSGDFTLCSNSPCLPDGNGWSEHVGSLGEGCGPCAPAVEPKGWGAIKALYR